MQLPKKTVLTRNFILNSYFKFYESSHHIIFLLVSVKDFSTF